MDTPSKLSGHLDRGAERLRAALARSHTLLEFEMAEVGRLAMERFLTERIIALCLASSVVEAGEVRIEDLLNAERERAGS